MRCVFPLCKALHKGKSFIAQALGHQGCLYGYKTGYHPCAKLFKQLKLCRADGSYLKELERIQKQDLVILDDLGLAHAHAPVVPFIFNPPMSPQPSLSSPAPR